MTPDEASGLIDLRRQAWSDYMPPATEDEVVAAFTRGEIRPWFQPLFTAGGTRIVGVEALLRWERGSDVVLTAGEFLVPLLAKPRTASVVSQMAFSGALAHAADLLDAHPDWSLWINASVAHLTEDWATAALGECTHVGIDPSRLVVEATEHGVDDVVLTDVAKILASAGTRLALDDFGVTGSWTNLGASDQFSIIKLDREVIRSAAHSAVSARLAEALCLSATNLGLTVVAEGIETDTEAAVARDIGADIVQGYLYAHPQPPETLIHP